MAIDQRNISAELRMMNDQQLQQYAAMHKADPYIFPLAFQESQNRQALRAGKTAQMAGMEQPKVADAALMAMTPTAAPEMQGIGKLPAPNMQHMADGGIAGFDESTNSPMSRENLDGMGNTGGMFNYAQDGGGVMRMAAGGHIPRYGGPTDGEDPDQVVSDDNRSFIEKLLYSNLTPAERARKKSLEDQAEGRRTTKTSLNAERDRNMAEVNRSNPNKTQETLERVGLATRQNQPTQQVVGQPATPANPPSVKVPSVGTNKPAPAPAPAAPTETAATTVGTPAYTPSNPEDIRRTADTMAKPELEEIQNAYKPYAEQFGQERTRLAEREKGNLSDALIRAGLGMIGGRSQFAGVNIGEGGIQGLNAYQEAQKADDAARKALMQSEMQMAAAQRAERTGARRDAVSLTHQAEQSKQVAVQLANQSQQIKNTEAFQQGQLEHYKRADAAAMLAAQNRGLGANANENKLILNALVKERDDIAKQLDPKANPFIHLSKNAEEKARLVARRNQLNAAIAGMTPEGTIPSGLTLAGSPTGSGGGDKVIDFNKI
jgi:hypothetical protein